MKKFSSRFSVLTAILSSMDQTILGTLLALVWRIMSSLKAFAQSEVDPKSFERLERRLERLCREIAIVLLEHSINHIESRERPVSIIWERRKFRPNRRTFHSIETRVGTIEYQRWFFQAELSFFVKGFAPLDQRLSLIGGRASPGVAHKLGRLAADLPQQPAMEQLREEFNVSLSVDTYRRVVESLSHEVRCLHDDIAIQQLVNWFTQAAKASGKHDVLLLVGRDGVHVPMRTSWKEAACATVAIFGSAFRRRSKASMAHPR